MWRFLKCTEKEPEALRDQVHFQDPSPASALWSNPREMAARLWDLGGRPQASGFKGSGPALLGFVNDRTIVTCPHRTS